MFIAVQTSTTSNLGRLRSAHVSGDEIQEVFDAVVETASYLGSPSEQVGRTTRHLSPYVMHYCFRAGNRAYGADFGRILGA